MARPKNPMKQTRTRHSEALALAEFVKYGHLPR